jgi:hypothetical protein
VDLSGEKPNLGGPPEAEIEKWWPILKAANVKVH